MQISYHFSSYFLDKRRGNSYSSKKRYFFYILICITMWLNSIKKIWTKLVDNAKLWVITAAALLGYKIWLWQTMSMTSPIPSTQYPWWVESDFSLQVAPWDSIILHSDHFPQTNAMTTNTTISPDGKQFSGTFAWDPSTLTGWNVVVTGDELTSVRWWYSPTFAGNEHWQLLINSEGGMPFTTSADTTRIVSLPEVLGVDGEPINCTIDSTSDGYNLTFGNVGPGEAFGSNPSIIITQWGNELYNGPLTPAALALITTTSNDLSVAITPDNNDAFIIPQGWTYTFTINDLPARLDNVAIFNAQTYTDISQQPDSTKHIVRLNNNTGIDMNYTFQCTYPQIGPTIPVVVPAGWSDYAFNRWDVNETYSVVTNNALWCVNSNHPDLDIIAKDTNTTVTSPDAAEAELTISIYPNPASDIVHFNGMNEVYDIDIFSTIGTLVWSIWVGGQKEVSSHIVQTLPAWAYITKFLDKKGNAMWSQKLTITH